MIFRSLVFVLALSGAGCMHGRSTPAPEPAPPAADVSIQPSPEFLRRADQDRVRVLEAEVLRLRADLRSAEETLVAVESGMRGAQGQARAVSALAETRIQLERAARRAPWRAAEVAEARAKLAEAEQRLAAQHIDSAVFFISRARRMAQSLLEEAERVKQHPGSAFVRGDRVNLRNGPSQDARIVATLSARLPVFVEGQEGDWSLVRTTTGDVGFVFSRFLSTP